jgi:hypothetical protein
MPSSEELAEVFFLAGVALPLAAAGKTIVNQKRSAVLATFDPLTDRFERIDEAPESWDLPFAMPADATDADCDVL